MLNCHYYCYKPPAWDEHTRDVIVVRVVIQLENYAGSPTSYPRNSNIIILNNIKCDKKLGKHVK